MLFQTVASVSYLPFALVLSKSLRQNVPDARLCVLVFDASAAIVSRLRAAFGRDLEIIGCDDLAVDGLAEMRQYYSVLEFGSACKVLALDFQLRTKGEAE